MDTKTRARSLLASLALLTLAACNTTPGTDSRPNPYAGGAQYPWTDTNVGAQATLINGYLSDQAWTFASSGWGPIELDKSNGEQNAGDGRQISLNGVKFNKGLGVHANSRVQYNLGGQCQSFQAVIGLDDEIRYQNQYGSVTFEVWADGSKLFDSGPITQASPNKTVLVDTFGRSSLTLVVNQQNENNWFDHADWADARVNCDGGTPGPLPNVRYLSDLPPVTAANGWGPIERDTSNGENLAGDGRPLSIRGQKFARGLGVHATSEIRYNLSGQCSRFQAVVGIDDEVGNLGSVVFQVFAGATKVFDSTVLTGTSPARTVDVSLTGAQELRLVVTNGGDNTNYDHADWADAKLTCSGTLPTARWNVLGNGAYTRGFPSSLKTDTAGKIYVVNTTDTSTSVQQWNGSFWTQVGPAFTFPALAELAINSSNQLFLAIRINNTTGNIYQVYRFNGSFWQPLSSTVFDTRFETPQMTFGSDGNPIIAYTALTKIGDSDVTTVPAVQVWRWNGSAWVPLGPNLGTPGTIQFGARIAAGSDGVPMVAWSERLNESSDLYSTYVRRWDGTTWQPLGGPIRKNPNNSTVLTRLAARGDQIAVLWYESLGLRNDPVFVYAQRWNGSAWVDFGGQLNSGSTPGFFPADMALGSDGFPVVAGYLDLPVRQVAVKRWNGSVWTDFPTPVNADTTKSASGGVLALLPDSTPVVLWSQVSDGVQCSGQDCYYVSMYQP